MKDKLLHAAGEIAKYLIVLAGLLFWLIEMVKFLEWLIS